jgi:hypothetical protein
MQSDTQATASPIPNWATWRDPAISRFNPLPRIIAFDQFANGHCGYTALVGNYEDTLDTVLESYRDMNQPMLSNGTHWDTGSHGAYDGTYALKIASRPRPRSTNMAMKRITFRKACPIQIEAYFAFKPEATELRLSDLDVGAFGLLLDLQDNERRVLPYIRYLNAFEGQRKQKWQVKPHLESPAVIGGSNETRSLPLMSQEGWADIPNGAQQLCYNEIATKYNWHYLRMGFDLRSMAFTSLQCNDRTYDVSAMEPMRMEAWPNLNCMMNVCWTVESDSSKRAFAYLDSVLVSGDWSDA